MSKVRVYEVAKQLNMDQKTLVALFQSMGIGDVRNHMSAVETDAIERVKRHLERQKTPDVVEERIRPTVVKRRARAQDRAVPPSPASERELSVEAPPSEAPTPRTRRAAAPPAAPSSARAAVPPSFRGLPEAPATTAHVDETPEAPASSRAARAARGSSPGLVHGDGGQAPEAAVAHAASPDLAAAPLAASIEEAGIPSAEASRPSSRGAKSRPRAEGAKSSRGAASSRGLATGAEVAAEASSLSALEFGAPEPEPVESFAPPVEPAPPEPVETSPSEAPRRPSSPPRTGIDVWQGRPGVPMPQARQSTPPARRTTYDPRASTVPARPGAGYGPGGRQMGGGGMRGRPGFRPRGGPSMPKKPTMVSTQEMSSHKKVIKIEEQVSLQQIAQKMSLKATDVLMRLLSMGMTGVHINSTLDADTAKILANEFGWSVEDVAVSEEDALVAAVAGEDHEEEGLEPRPPIVTVMGHVDHGKTSLLDRIRKASVAVGEAGGITQHIGAYRVELPTGVIAFLDTPGHEAFTAMRARGASVTDIVILVVAADDGVMPQTKEAIAHAQNARVPIIVAINKIDKPGADPERIRRDLATHGLQSEDWGGDTQFVHVSALTGEGIDQLLEAILLQSEILELKANPKKKASGVVVEALLDRGRGPVARVMVQDGTLQTGDILLAGPAWGKVRAMTDEAGRPVTAAGPATPVEVLGLNEVPSAGDPVHVVKDAKTAEEIAEGRRKKQSKSLIPQDSRVSLEALTTRLSEADNYELKLIVKGDVQGSVEAVCQALTKLSTDKVKVTIVHAGVGGITEGDVNLAVASKAIIAGFNVRPAGKASSLAESEGVEIRLYNIIYNAIDDIRSAMEGLLPATKIEKPLGKAEVRQVFKIAKTGGVAGCMVIDGTIKRSGEARLVRDSVVVYTGKVAGLRRFKDDVKEVSEGMECGITLENYQDIKEGDVIEVFEIEEVKTKLA